MAIPYDPKVDIALDDLQVLTLCYEALKENYREKYQNNNDEVDPKLLTAMETQTRINNWTLYIIEKILAPSYPRADHNNNDKQQQ